MRMINYNYTQQKETAVTYSSQNVNFPASNIKHEFRSKQWRSNSSGNFVVTSPMNKIDFKESGGGPGLVAIITPGTYNATTLAAEIKTQMQTAGASIYTVTHSASTGLWRIVTAGAYLSLLNATGTNQVNSILKGSLGFPNSDSTGSLTYTGSNIAIHTSEWIGFDTATTEAIDSVVLLWPKEDGITLSSNAVVRIQANATNVWTAPAVDQLLTLNQTYERYSHFFATSQSYRYWRLTITDPANANLYVSVGVIVLGQHVAMVNPDNGFQFTLDDNSKITSTDFGHEYVDEYPLSALLEINYGLLDYADAVAMDAAYRSNGNRIPIYITIDDQSTVTNKDHYALYGKFRGSLGIKHIRYDMFQSKVVISEIS